MEDVNPKISLYGNQLKVGTTPPSKTMAAPLPKSAYTRPAAVGVLISMPCASPQDAETIGQGLALGIASTTCFAHDNDFCGNDHDNAAFKRK